ncbi:hypothetical protein PXH59_19870 (plasmid) [Xenorhabdus sp. SF857]|uniref:hypothetical protein n=1 Tax=Xenorhabdus bakwenae TaxID=3026967 RepID=UPI00255805AE|nr:hypothetical protein [Xenorhabdus sp. SF857]WFQ81608.1 hypothetical protein PXH59_19870 [Xenorhabdus sp. SF857]
MSILGRFSSWLPLIPYKRLVLTIHQRITIGWLSIGTNDRTFPGKAIPPWIAFSQTFFIGKAKNQKPKKITAGLPATLAARWFERSELTIEEA